MAHGDTEVLHVMEVSLVSTTTVSDGLLKTHTSHPSTEQTTMLFWLEDCEIIFHQIMLN